MRTCAECSGSLEGKRPQAVYCTRTCKQRATERRRPPRRRDRREYALARYHSIQRGEWEFSPDATPEQRAEQERRRREYVREYNKAYYRRNREARIAWQREWARNHPGERRARHERRARLIRENPGYAPFTAREWGRVLAQYRHACAYCGATDLALQMDHVIPLTRGGRHAIGNVVPACKPCNVSKYNHFLSEWKAIKGRR